MNTNQAVVWVVGFSVAVVYNLFVSRRSFYFVMNKLRNENIDIDAAYSFDPDGAFYGFVLGLFFFWWAVLPFNVVSDVLSFLAKYLIATLEQMVEEAESEENPEKQKDPAKLAAVKDFLRTVRAEKRTEM